MAEQPVIKPCVNIKCNRRSNCFRYLGAMGRATDRFPGDDACVEKGFFMKINTMDLKLRQITPLDHADSRAKKRYPKVYG